jgi:chromosome segregation ATPase
MTQLGLDQNTANQAAAIFGYGGNGSLASRMSDGSTAPLTQLEAIAKIEEQYTRYATLEQERDTLTNSKKEVETKLEKTENEFKDLKEKFDANAQQLEEIHNAELKTLEEKVAEIDTEGKFLKTLEELPFQQKKSVMTTYLETTQSADVKLSNGSAKGSTKQQIDDASKSIFGATVEEMVSEYAAVGGKS